MSSIVQFTACEHLDFSEKYQAKANKEVLGEKVFWMRDTSFDPEIPSMVQFCKKRGRLNDPYSCTTENKARCSLYIQATHKVEVSGLEQCSSECGRELEEF